MIEPFASAAEKLYTQAQWSVAHRNLEADLRADLFSVLGPYATDIVQLRLEDVRQEGTGKAGRFDSLFGRVLFEYKRPHRLDSMKERFDAAQQGLGYLEDESVGAQVVIITDGSTWGFYRDTGVGPEVGEQGWLFDELKPAPDPYSQFSWHTNSEATARRVLTLLETVKSAPVTPENVQNRLGVDRQEVRDLLTILAERLKVRFKDGRADILFHQWIQLAGVAYGISTEKSAFPKEPRRILGKDLVDILAPLGYAGSIFVLHTYVSLASKLLACELLALIKQQRECQPTQWVLSSDEIFARQIRAMEFGEVSDDLDAPNLIAADLFGWWVDDLFNDKDFTAAVRNIIQAMDELAWARIANAGGIAIDLLRGLYQEVVPAELRKSLGEFFTPRYLAERVIAKAEDLAQLPTSHQPRILDPSCGSGTFLVAAMRRGLARLVALDLADDVEALETLVDSVVGFDINPVAPIMTKVNLLLSLGDRAASLTQIDFNVYQADSILLPRLETGQATFDGPSISYEVLPLEIGDIELPQALATLDGVKLLRENIDVGLHNNRSPKQFAERLRVDVAKLSEVTDIDETIDMCRVVYERILKLKEEEKDGVWSHVIEQSYAPKALQTVDIVVGNPPWISWKNLPDRWKARSETTWRQWGLWQTSGKSVPLSDISTLLFARSIATYCPHGVVGMLLPRSVLIADPGGRKIRLSLVTGLRSDYQRRADLG